MGLGYNASVHRLDTDDATRCSDDGAHLAERFRSGDVKSGALVHKETFSWVQWLDDAVAAGEGVVIEKAGGFPDSYLVRGRRCPLVGEASLGPGEWLYVELWDEG